MDQNAGKGGSYVRQKDGSLKLASRTETTKATPVKSTAAKPAGTADTSKEASNG